MSEVVRQTTAGAIRGREDDGVVRFMGVPYAAAPVGPLRFAPPEPPAPWTGVRDAVDPGPTAPQVRRPFAELDSEPLTGTGWRRGDDYLALNIWAPATASGALPVLVFIHGGGFQAGSGDVRVQDGAAFARSGVVCVTINYRLGLEGFAVFDDAPTNLGLRDQIAALHWVKDNIAAFGGDADRVTICGESAGAMSVADLMASPLADGLFRRAIIQSGQGEMVRSRAVAQRLTRLVARRARCEPTARAFRERSIEDSLEAVSWAYRPSGRIDLREADGDDAAAGIARFLPMVGDDVLPIKPIDALAAGASKSVDLLIGYNRDEMNLYLVPSRMISKLNDVLVWLLLPRLSRAAWKEYRRRRKQSPRKPAGELFGEVLSDRVFIEPCLRFAQAHQGRTFAYALEWPSPAFGGRLGACHGLDLPLVFDTIASCQGPKSLLGDANPKALASEMHGAWVRFITDGDPGWTPYDGAGTIRRFR